jgi:molybdopterin-guanine dinucleotide biosynthesis protein A
MRGGSDIVGNTVPMEPPPVSRNFAAALLAGGKSTRMGRDKSAVETDGIALWRRQLATLRALAPCELFVSGNPDGPYSGAGVEIVSDATPGFGPLGGIAAVMERMTAGHLLALAIDMPAMSAEFLGGLLAACEPGRGLVPLLNGEPEPLAAVYPAACLPLVRKGLAADDRSMRTFVRRAIGGGLVKEYAVSAEHAPLFRNVNSPCDL